MNIVAPKLTDLNPFDEARAQLDEWQRDFPDSTHVVLILNAPDEMATTVAGPAIKPSYAAGLCLFAANTILEPE